MIVFTSILIGLMLLAAMWHAYVTTRDPLHPLIYLAPLCLYSYSLKPIMLDYIGMMEAFFEPDQRYYGQLVNALGLAAFCLASLYHANRVQRARVSGSAIKADFDQVLTPVARERVLAIAWLLGGVAVGTYWIMIISVGGVEVVYGEVKGGITTASGYVNEMPMLCLCAIGMLYLAWTRQRFTIGRVLLLLVMGSPLIVHGLLGSRRGPTFMVISALLIGGYLVSPRRPKLITVFSAVAFLGTLILFLVSNRDRIFIGSRAIDEWTTGTARQVQDLSVGDDWVHSTGTIITSRDTHTHFWGTRILVNLFVRPIPKQIWPDKYIDTGFGWLEGQEDMLGMTDNEWRNSLGWVPARGAAAGMVADLYLEFAWLGILGCWGIGWVYSWLWQNMVLRRGIWSLLYMYAAILSIYVPTQNVTDAWIYRLIMLSVPTIILWRLLVQPVLTPGDSSKPAPMAAKPIHAFQRLSRRRLRRPVLRSPSPHAGQ